MSQRRIVIQGPDSYEQTSASIGASQPADAEQRLYLAGSADLQIDGVDLGSPGVSDVTSGASKVGAFDDNGGADFADVQEAIDYLLGGGPFDATYRKIDGSNGPFGQTSIVWNGDGNAVSISNNSATGLDVFGSARGIDASSDAGASARFRSSASGNTDPTVIIAEHASGQTANMLEIRASGSAPVMSVDQDGNTAIDGTLAVDGNATLGDSATADAHTINGGVTQNRDNSTTNTSFDASFIDIDDSANDTTNNTKRGIYVDQDSTGTFATSTGQGRTLVGVDADVADTGAYSNTASQKNVIGARGSATATGAAGSGGAANAYGLDGVAVGDSNGTSIAAGVRGRASGADTNYGLWADTGSLKVDESSILTGPVTHGGTTIYTAQVFTVSAAGSSLTVTGTYIRVNNTTGGAITLTSTPTIADGIDGQIIHLINTSAQNVVLQDQGTLANSNLILAGSVNLTLGQTDSVSLMYSSDIGDWIQIGASNN